MSSKYNSLKVEEYQFQGFSDEDLGIKNFEFVDLSELNGNNHNLKERISDIEIRREREHAQQTKFEINEAVRKYRGIDDQELQDYEKRVSAEVEKRVAQQLQQIKQEAYQEGRDQGANEAYEEAKVVFDQKLEELAQMIDEVRVNREEIYKKEFEDMYKMIKALTKWILLRETKEETYIPRLLEKLILEINQKNNLLIKVSPESFDYMENAVNQIENKLGSLSNLRIEIDPELQYTGIVLESDKGIIDGSLESQFESIDRVFESVGIVEDGES